jgi:hypothetical protein
MHIKLLPQTMTIDGITFNNIQQTKHKNTSIGFCDKYIVKIQKLTPLSMICAKQISSKILSALM